MHHKQFTSTRWLLQAIGDCKDCIQLRILCLLYEAVPKSGMGMQGYEFRDVGRGTWGRKMWDAGM